MNGKARFVGALVGALHLSFALTTLTTDARAAEPDAAAKAEAAKRFDRGLTLFDEGDNAGAALNFELIRAEATRDANVTVRSRVPDAEVFVNGKSAGKTPLASSVSVTPGHVSLELRRPGYTPVKQQLDLTEGATSDVTLDPTIDSKALATEGVFLALDVGRKDADLFVDQEHIGPYTAPIRLPKGLHRVRIEAAGFMPLERDLTLEEGKNNILSDKLDPTPETRAAYDSNVSFHRIWGWVGIGAGALIAGGGAAFL